MRKLILNLFALNFKTKFGGQLRVATFTFPLVLGLVYTGFKHYPDSVFYSLFSLVLILLFFGFIYFRFRPIGYYPDDFDKLTKSQKNQYLMYNNMKPDDLTRDSIFWILINPILMVLTIILMSI